MKVLHLLALVGLGAVALVGFDQYRSRMAGVAQTPPDGTTTRVQPRTPAGEPAWGTGAASQATPVARAAPAAAGPAVVASGTFRCDGRTHCSQMTSCAEAEYFLRNCPNVKMDGNHDGEPCEQQWCN